MDLLGFLQLAVMGGSVGLLAAIGYASWVIVKRAIAFFDQHRQLVADVNSIQKSITVMNHNSNRLERALIYAHILKPEDFQDDA